MVKSATEVMHEVIVAAVTDAVDALKRASGATPNTLVRELHAIHPNTAFADLPRELQAAITASVRNAFNRLLKEGYTVSEGRAAPAPAPLKPRRPHEHRRAPNPAGRPPRPPKPRGPGKR